MVRRNGTYHWSGNTDRHVKDVLWKELRAQRKGRGGLMPKEPRMDMPGFDDWFAIGMTATDDHGFHGRHAKYIFIIFDEATGIDPDIWRGAKGMMTNANAEVYWLCICNPTDPTSQAYIECQKGSELQPKAGQFKVMSISALDHPNIAAQLAGEEPPYPDAVGIDFIDAAVEDWCTPIEESSKTPDSVLWRGQWYHPGPEFEGKVLGRWPSSTSDGVWSDMAWKAAINSRQELDEHDELVLSADLAAGGKDFTTIMGRRGQCVFHHETHNGWSAGQIAARMKELADKFAMPWEEPHDVRLQIDHDQVGYSILNDHADDYNFISVSGARRSDQPERYPNLRSQLWFATAEGAMKGNVDLSRLSIEVLSELERQLKAPKWKMVGLGQRQVEQKLLTKRFLKRSPDDADALNLLFYTPNEGKMRASNGRVNTSASSGFRGRRPGARTETRREMRRRIGSEGRNQPSFMRR
jgi:hypothetical protein